MNTKERTATIKLNSGDREVYAGNSSLFRYKDAGGSFNKLEKLNTEGSSIVDLIEASDEFLTFISANLVGEPKLTTHELTHELDDLVYMAEFVSGVFKEIPWFKNSTEPEAKEE